MKEEYTIKMLRHAMDLGVNYFDTAVGYCNQESQVVLGKAIKGRRDKLYISTKNPRGLRSKPVLTKKMTQRNGVGYWRNR